MTGHHASAAKSRYCCRVPHFDRRGPVCAALAISVFALIAVLGSHAINFIIDTTIAWAFSADEVAGGRTAIMRCMATKHDAAACALAWPGLTTPALWQATLGPVDLLPWAPSETRGATEAQLSWLDSLRRRRSGRGIVMCVGNRQAASALALLETLYGPLGSSLPVEVFHLGPADLHAGWHARLRAVPGSAGRVSLRDLRSDLAGAARHAPGWFAKVFAALFSRFAEVIVVDADAVLLRRPEDMLAEAEGAGAGGPYAATGTLMWRDRCVFRAAAPGLSGLARLAAAVGLPLQQRLTPPSSSNAHDATALALAHASVCSDVLESGFIALDTRRDGGTLHWALAAAALLSDGLSRPLLGGLSHGDKELWWLGAAAVGAPFALEAHASGLVGRRVQPEALPAELLAAPVEGCPTEGPGGGRPTGGAVCSSFHGHIVHLRHAAGDSDAPIAEWWNGGAAVGKAVTEPFVAGTFEAWAAPLWGGGDADSPLPPAPALTWQGAGRGLPPWAVQCVLLVPGCTVWGDLTESQRGAAGKLAAARSRLGGRALWA